MQKVEFRFHLLGNEVYGFHKHANVTKGVAVLVHGFGEHSGRYEQNVIPMLLASGLAVVSYDNVGHGMSGGKRGHCSSYDTLLDILAAVIHKAETTFPDVPVYFLVNG